MINLKTGRRMLKDGPTASIPKGHRVSRRSMVRSPKSGRWILANGPTAQRLRAQGWSLPPPVVRVVRSKYAKGCSNARRPGRTSLPLHVFCGPAGGACDRSYPVTSPQKAVAALSRAWRAPNPSGLRRCVRGIARRKGWLDSQGKIKLGPRPRRRRR